MARNDLNTGVAWLRLQQVKPYNINSDANYKLFSHFIIEEKDFHSFQKQIMPTITKKSLRSYKKLFYCKDKRCGASYRDLKQLAKHCLKHLHILLPKCDFLNDLAKELKRLKELERKDYELRNFQSLINNEKDVHKVVYGSHNKVRESNNTCRITLNDLNNFRLLNLKADKELEEQDSDGILKPYVEMSENMANNDIKKYDIKTDNVFENQYSETILESNDEVNGECDQVMSNNETLYEVSKIKEEDITIECEEIIGETVPRGIDTAGSVYYNDDSQDSFQEINSSVANILSSLNDDMDLQLIDYDDNIESEVTITTKITNRNKSKKQNNNYYSNGSFKCNYCRCRFLGNCELTKHLEHFHNIIAKNMCAKSDKCSQYVSCFYCGFVGVNEELETHLISSHYSISCQFKCPLCKSKCFYDNRQCLIKHLKSDHDINLNLPITTDPMSILFINQKCKICTADFLAECDMNKHLLNNNFKCKKCSLNFDNMLLLTKHLDEKHQKTSTLKKYHKSTVSSAFKINNSLKLKVVHNPPKPKVRNSLAYVNKNTCTVCDKSFDTSEGIYKHLIMKHTNLCTCLQCNEDMYTFIEMSRHVEKVHKYNFTGYICNICGLFGIKDVRLLILHLRNDHNIPECVLK